LSPPTSYLIDAQLERPEVPVPDPEMLDDPGVRQAAPSIVRVVSASGVSGSAGSGWIAASELVVTNAHVIADADYIVVQPEGVGEQLEAEVLIFDERNDLAVLGVEGWISPPWNSPSPSPASPSPSSVTRKTARSTCGRVGQTQRVLTSDIRGRGPVERQVTVLRSPVSRGNTGGPAVNADGQVVATVFAERAGAEGVAYGIPSSVVEEAIRAAEQQRAWAATTGCVSVETLMSFKGSSHARREDY
jgi:S1-C subfamily serine protease